MFIDDENPNNSNIVDKTRYPMIKAHIEPPFLMMKIVKMA